MRTTIEISESLRQRLLSEVIARKKKDEKDKGRQKALEGI